MAENSEIYQRQLKMKQKDYFQLLQQQENSVNISRKLQPNVKQLKIKQKDLIVLLANQERTENVYSSLQNGTHIIRPSSRPESVQSLLERTMQPDVDLTKGSDVNSNSNYPKTQTKRMRNVYVNHQSMLKRNVHHGVTSFQESSAVNKYNNSTEHTSHNGLHKVPPRSILKKPKDTSILLTKDSTQHNEIAINGQNKNIPHTGGKINKPDGDFDGDDYDNIADLIFEEESPYDFVSPRDVRDMSNDNTKIEYQSRLSPQEYFYHDRRVNDNNRRSYPPNNKSVAFVRQNHYSYGDSNNNVSTGYSNNISHQNDVYLRRPQLRQEGIVDLGTYLSSKLSGLKFKSHEKSMENNYPNTKLTLKDVRHVSSPTIQQGKNGKNIVSVVNNTNLDRNIALIEDDTILQSYLSTDTLY